MMTDRYKALTVVLARDVRDDDAQSIINAISMVKGVLSVEPNVADFDDYVHRERLYWKFREKLLQALDDERVKPSSFATMD